MQTELYIKTIFIFCSLLMGLVLSQIIYLFIPNRWGPNKAKRIGLTFAMLGILLPLGLYMYNNWQDLTPAERIKFREVASKSEAHACQEAGYLADGYFWDDVHHHSSSHHFNEGSFAFRLLCLDENHLAREIFPPKCHSLNLKACK